MDVAAGILIAIGVLVGLAMAYQATKRMHIPKGPAPLRSAAVMVGLAVLLIVAITAEQQNNHWDSSIIFAYAASGGAYMFHKDVTHQRFPLRLVDVYGLIRLSGLPWLSIHITV